MWYHNIQIGIHGIQIEFQDGKHTRTATYLPEVAREQGWTKPQTIDSLMRKGGYKHQVTNEMRSRVKLTRYQSEKCVATYDDFIRSQRRHRPYWWGDHSYYLYRNIINYIHNIMKGVVLKAPPTSVIHYLFIISISMYYHF